MKTKIINRPKSIRRMRNEAISIFLFSGAILGLFIGIGGPNAIFKPQVTTMFLHYNLQYRAGNITVENTILNESIREMVKIMDGHEKWKYTIEVQAYAIERLLNEPNQFPGILEMIQRQVNRQQLELICGVYSSQILNAYPGDPLIYSMSLTKQILSQANLTRSRVILFQEGQYAPGLAYYLNQSDWSDIDTVILSGQQIDDFWPTWQEKPSTTIPLYVSKLGNKEHYILRYDYVPRVEAGRYHGWIFWSDGELALEYADDPPNGKEFSVDPERVKNFEAHFADLERRGNIFMTIEEWMEYCLANGYIMDLDHYQPSTHWGPTKYDTCYIWYGNGNGNVDDGDMLADNYRGRNVLAATLQLNNSYYNQLSSPNQITVNKLLNQAMRSLINAMVTDTTGITPNTLEREYGYNNIRTVFLNCSSVVKIYCENIGELAGIQQIQMNLADKTNNTSPIKLISYTSANKSLDTLNELLPFTFQATTTGDAPSISVRNASVFGTDLLELAVNFPGTNNWSIRNDHIAVNFLGDLSSLIYCPPLAEDLTIQINRSDYLSEDLLNMHLPISNGLLFVPAAENSNTGYAIIHNASQYHLAPRWTTTKLSYMTGPISIPAPMQFFIIPNISLTQAQNVANRINNKVTWTIGTNATLMQGFEYLEFYFNSYRGDGWTGGEWW